MDSDGVVAPAMIFSKDWWKGEEGVNATIIIAGFILALCAITCCCSTRKRTGVETLELAEVTINPTVAQATNAVGESSVSAVPAAEVQMTDLHVGGE